MIKKTSASIGWNYYSMTISWSRKNVSTTDPYVSYSEATRSSWTGASNVKIKFTLSNKKFKIWWKSASQSSTIFLWKNFSELADFLKDFYMLGRVNIFQTKFLKNSSLPVVFVSLHGYKDMGMLYLLLETNNVASFVHMKCDRKLFRQLKLS